MFSSSHNYTDFLVEGQPTPYTLFLVVGSAEKLAIGDYTSSDPYVTVAIDNKKIGKTTTVYKNLSPTWDASFIIPLFHTHHTMTLTIYDEDIDSNDDFLGALEFRIDSLPIGDVGDEVRQLRDGDNTKDVKGKLKYSILLTKCKSLVKFQLDPNVLNTPLYNASKQTDSCDNVVEYFCPFEKVVSNYSSLLFKGNIGHDYLFRDIVSDIECLPGAATSRKLSNMYSFQKYSSRACRQLISSSQLDLLTGKSSYRHNYPMRSCGFCIQVDRTATGTAGEHSYEPLGQQLKQQQQQVDHFFEFPDRFRLWSWVRWLRVAEGYWRKNIKFEDLPSWILENDLTYNGITLHRSDEEDLYGSVNISLTRPFVIRCTRDNSKRLAGIGISSLARRSEATRNSSHGFDIDISRVSVLSITADSVPWKRLQLRIEQVFVRRFDPLEQSKDSKSSSRSIADAAAEVGRNVAATVRPLARVAATADVPAANMSIQSAVIGVGNVAGSLLRRGANAAVHGDFGMNVADSSHPSSSSCYVVVRCGMIAHQLRTVEDVDDCIYWIESFSFDFDASSAETTKNDTSSSSGQDADADCCSSLSPQLRGDELVEFFYCRGESGQETPIAYGAIELDCVRRQVTISRGSSSSNVATAASVSRSDKQGDAQEVDSAHARRCSLRVPLNQTLSLLISLKTLTNISAEYMTSSGIISSLRSACVSCELVDWNTVAMTAAAETTGTSSLFKSNKVLQSPFVAVTSSVVDWRDFQFSLSLDAAAGASLPSAQYLLLKVFTDAPIESMHCLGCAYIDISDVSLELKSFTLGVVPAALEKDGVGLKRDTNGILTVTAMRVIAPAAKANSYVLDFDCSFGTDSTNEWAASAVLAGALISSAQAVEGEDCSVVLAYEHLELRCDDMLTTDRPPEGSNKVNKSSVTMPLSEDDLNSTATATVDGNGNADSNADGDAKEMIIEAFENEKRSALPPFEFSSDALLFHSRFTDESGDASLPYNNLDLYSPPAGYAWKDAWTVDMWHSSVDMHGWSYAMSLEQLRNNYKTGHSSKRAVFKIMRRRRWVRTAVLIPPSYRNPSLAPPHHPVTSNIRRSLSASAVTSSGKCASTAGSTAGDRRRNQKSSLVRSVFQADVSSIRRNQLHSENPNAVIQLCKERVSLDHNVVRIPWSQVESADVVTSSILSITVNIQRFFGIDKVSSNDVYKPARVDLFVYNCPATLLAAQIEDRILFYSIRDDVSAAIQSEANLKLTIEKSNETAATATTGGSFVSDVVVFKNYQLELCSGGKLETRQLSRGSQMVRELETDIAVLAETIDDLSKQYESTSDELILERKRKLEVRVCRLEFYMALLIDACTSTQASTLSLSTLQSVLSADFDTLQLIARENEVETFINKLEYLLDMFELRARDAALRGWAAQSAFGADKQEGSLESFLEGLSTEYLIRMCDLMGRYFRPQDKVINNIKGLMSKSRLLVAVMEHNDTMANVLESALRIYSLQAAPRPVYTAYFDLNLLLSWYNTLLHTEMVAMVEDVLSFWKDPANDASGMSTMYTTSLPWTPLRLGGSQGIFLTRIPEDCRSRLEVYLTYARLKESSASKTFKNKINQLDEKVVASYVESFLVVVEEYQKALRSKVWTCAQVESSHTAGTVTGTYIAKMTNADIKNETSASIEGELEQHFEWLCSAANDLRRLQESEIAFNVAGYDRECTKNKAASGNSMYAVIYVASGSINVAMDYAACIIFKLLSMLDSRWLSDDTKRSWLPVTAELLSVEAESFENQLDELRLYLLDHQTYLESVCFYKLTMYCASKLVLRYLYVLKTLSAEGRRCRGLHSAEYAHVKAAFEQIKSCFESILEEAKMSSYETDVRNQFQYLDFVVALIESEPGSLELSQVLESLYELAVTYPQDRAAISVFAESMYLMRQERCVVAKAAKAERTTAGMFRVSSHDGLSSMRFILPSEISDFQAKVAALPSFSPQEEAQVYKGSKYVPLSKVFTTTTTEINGKLALTNILLQLSSSAMTVSGSKMFSLGMFTGSSSSSSSSSSTATASVERNSFKKLSRTHVHSQPNSRLSKSKVRNGALSASKGFLLKLGHSNRMCIPEGITINSPKYKTIKVAGLAAGNLVGFLRKPKAYLTLTVGETTHKTSVKEGSDYLSWSDEEFLFTLDSLERSALHCALHYRGEVYGTYQIGDVCVPLSSLDISNIVDSTHSFEMTGVSRTAMQSAAAASKGVYKKVSGASSSVGSDNHSTTTSKALSGLSRTFVHANKTEGYGLPYLLLTVILLATDGILSSRGSDSKPSSPHV